MKIKCQTNQCLADQLGGCRTNCAIAKRSVSLLQRVKTAGNSVVLTLLLLACGHAANAAFDPMSGCLNKTALERASNEACKNYLSGFISGMLAAHVVSIEQGEKEVSSFLDRIYRTRTPFPTSQYYKKKNTVACFPAQLSREQIVEKINQTVHWDEIQTNNVEEKILHSVKNTYPCA